LAFLEGWNEGKTTSGDMAEIYRMKLQAFALMPKGDVNMYINEFIHYKN